MIFYLFKFTQFNIILFFLLESSFMVWEIFAQEEEQMFITGQVLIFDLKGTRYEDL